MDHREYMHARASAASESEREQLYDRAKALENEDRRCFSQTRDGWEVAGREDLSSHPHPSLVPLFDEATGQARETFRIDKPSERDCEPRHRVLPLNRAEREALAGKSAVVGSLDEFKSTFHDVFCEGLLRYLNWDNVFAAGGGVLACAVPVPDEHAVDNGTKRKYFHDLQYSASDVDLFLYGLDPEQARRKLVEIYKAVCDACPHQVACFRSAHAVTLVSQYPFRHIQIVLRLYSSPYEVLAGFDVDACTIGYDGKMVYADVRAHHALVTRRNTIDLTRRSPSYEMRLAKYGVRGFEVEVKDLNRDMIDPGIFERPWASLEGLAKLLVLETLQTPEKRNRFFEMQKLQRSGNEEGQNRRYIRRGRTLDAKTQERIEEQLGGTAEVSNYSTVFLPWGPGQTAQTTMALMTKKDLKLNSPYFMRERKYRLHPCFFGTAEEILRDCSPDDPPFPPRTEDEDAKLKEHRETYVRGPLEFIVDDPGRQRIGSFHPLSEEGWSEGVYFLATTEALFAAVNANDIAKVKEALKSVPSPDIRDFFGRTALHLSLIAGSKESALVLLEHGSSPLEPMAGGRTVFHLTALYNRVDIISVLVSAAESIFAGKQTGRDSAENTKKTRSALRQFLRARDKDAELSPIQMALLLGNLDAAKELLDAGAILKSEPVEAKEEQANVVANQLVGLLPNEHMEEGVKLLLKFGYSCAERWDQTNRYRNELSWLVAMEDEVAVECLSRLDSTFNKALSVLDENCHYPLTEAVNVSNPTLVRLLLQNGSPTMINDKMILDAEQILKNRWRLQQVKNQRYSIVFEAVRAFLQKAEQYLEFWRIINSRHNIWRASPSQVRNQARRNMEEQNNPTMVEHLLGQEPQNCSQQSVEKAAAVCQLFANSPDLNETFKVFDAYDFHYGIDDRSLIPSDYWTKDTPEGAKPPALSARDFTAVVCGLVLGHLTRLTADPFPSRRLTGPLHPGTGTFEKVCLNLERILREYGRTHTEELVRAWRMSTLAMDDTSAEAVFKDMDPSLRERVLELQKERYHVLEKLARQLPVAYGCDERIVEYYHTLERPFRRRDDQPHPGQTRDPSHMFYRTVELFPDDNSDADRALKDYFLKNEHANPQPDSLPSNRDDPSIQSAPWAQAGMERSLFKVAARTYRRLDPKAARYQHTDLQYPSLWMDDFNAGRFWNPTFYPDTLQSHCDQLFALCRTGKAEGVANICTVSGLPVTSMDAEHRTPLTLAILATSPELIVEIVTLARQQYKKEKEASKKRTERMDNFELMKELEDDESSSEGQEDDNEDENDGDGEDENVEGGDKRDTGQVEQINGAPPDSLFCLGSGYYLGDIPGGRSLEETLRSFEKEHDERFANIYLDQSIAPHAQLTPLQLAIIVNSAPVVSALLTQAKAISPYLVQSILQHRFEAKGERFHNRYSKWSTVHLAVALDRVELLQLIISEAGYGLEMASFASRLCQSQWKLRADVANSGGKAPITRYQGIISSLSETQKRKAAQQRDPRLQRLEHLPYPEATLLHLAAYFGAPKVFKFLADTGPSSSLLGAVKKVLSSQESVSIRELFAAMREVLPSAFSKKFGPQVSLESDARIFIYGLLGGDVAQGDSNNRHPIHLAVLNGSLTRLLDGGIVFPTEYLSQLKSGSVSIDERIRFLGSTLSGLGSYFPGGSPLLQAAYINDTASCEVLINRLGFDPAASDEHWAGVNALHISIYSEAWEAAQALAPRLKPGDLLSPSSIGVNTIMTAAKSGTLRGLQSIIPALPTLFKPSDVNLEGLTPLHLAATARYSETLRTLLDWFDTNGGSLSEDFTTGRTALDCAISSLVVQGVSNHAVSKRYDQTVAELSTRKPYAASKGELLTNGRAAALAAVKRLLPRPHVRALYPQVRPARERRLRKAVGLDDEDDVVRQAREDLIGVFGQSAHEGNLDAFVKGWEDTKSALDFIISGPCYAVPPALY